MLSSEQYRNNFPICAAIEIGTAGKADGYVRDDKSGFGKLFWDPFPDYTFLRKHRGRAGSVTCRTCHLPSPARLIISLLC